MTLATSFSIQDAPLGATRLGGGEWRFVLWAPFASQVELHIIGPRERFVEMESLERGYHAAVLDADGNSLYRYRLNRDRELPDPASRFQPEGVHGPSCLVDTRAFRWSDQHWAGVPLQDNIFYELHVGTFTEEGTFDAAIAQLKDLVDLGVTTVELMPVAQFPGARNWGYDGVYPYAAQNSYGGPAGLQRFVNAAHEVGIAVALDVVYNHLGPEGNYLSGFGPYFTDRYRTPWGEALNYDGEYSDEVRRYFIGNALYWLEEFHIDSLRLDAIHSIYDFSARPFLAELKNEVASLAGRLGRHIHVIAESDLNDVRVLQPQDRGGCGMDAQWSDDFHHSVHTLLTGENAGYYQDYGSVSQMAAIMRDGWYFHGQYSNFRKRRHGNSTSGTGPSHFVVCSQNHDQVGNRALGERLSALVDFESQKLAAGITLLSPFLPLLFMGEEYGETAPFQYFTSHGDTVLVEAVRRGRHEEFAAFGWQEAVPDPQDEATFRRSQLQHSVKAREPHAILLRLYRELIRLRRELKIAGTGGWESGEQDGRIVWVARERVAPELLMTFNFSDTVVLAELPAREGLWQTRFDSAGAIWGGQGDTLPTKVSFSAESRLRLQAHSFAVFEKLPSVRER